MHFSSDHTSFYSSDIANKLMQALTRYKRELKGQFKKNLDEIEHESRAWLKKNATGLSGEQLVKFFSDLDKGRSFDINLPVVHSDFAEALEPAFSSVLNTPQRPLMLGMGNDVDTPAIREPSRLLSPAGFGW